MEVAMAPLPPLPRHLTHLSRLPIDDLRQYATFAYGRPPYTQTISAVLATGGFFAPGAVLIALYPPDVPPEKALAEPPDFPTWRYYIDGRWLFVATKAEYDRLDHGHSGRPDGPWPEGVVTQVRWDPCQGIYAPVEGWRPYGSAPEPQGHPDRRVFYPHKPDIYYGRVYARGEVFFLRGESVMDDEQLLADGVVKIVPRFVTLVRHDWTGRWFVDKASRDAYALRYGVEDITDWLASFRAGAVGGAQKIPPSLSSGEVQKPQSTRRRPGRDPLSRTAMQSFTETLIATTRDLVPQYGRPPKSRVFEHWPTNIVRRGSKRLRFTENQFEYRWDIYRKQQKYNSWEDFLDALGISTP
jgi:hypothetical protein